jgi:tetratricopeptide (TPR) repeat protein
MSILNSQGAADFPVDRPDRHHAVLPGFPRRVFMMMRARLIRFIRVSFFPLVVVYLCLSIRPASAAGGDGVLSAQEWFDRGRFMGEIGNYRKAVEAFSRVIELYPDFAHAYNNRGVAHSELGNFRLAIQDCNRAVNLDPDEAAFRFNRGIAFGRGGEYDMAIEDFKRVIEMDPQHTRARFFLGLVQRSMPGEIHKGVDNIKSSAHLGDKDAREYLRSRMMGGWY